MDGLEACLCFRKEGHTSLALMLTAHYSQYRNPIFKNRQNNTAQSAIDNSFNITHIASSKI
jgi:hypothetical protein